MAILAMQRERKLEQRDSDEEESSTGLEDKEKHRNATELTRGQPCMWFLVIASYGLRSKKTDTSC